MKCKHRGKKLEFTKPNKHGVVFVNCPDCGRQDAFMKSELPGIFRKRLRA